MSVKGKSVAFLNQVLGRARSANFTYKNSKAAYSATTGGKVLSKKLFHLGMMETQLSKGATFSNAEGFAKIVDSNLSLDMKAIKKVRKQIAINGGAVVFRKIRGRIVPVRVGTVKK